MSRAGRKVRKGVNPFDVIIILLVLCLIATLGYRIYNGVAEKNDSRTSSYLMIFECNGEISSLTNYLESGTPVYLSQNGELLGYIYEESDALTVFEMTDNTVAPSFETEAEDGEDAVAESETVRHLSYSYVNIVGKIRLCRDVNVYDDGVYYTLGDLNFAVGSTLTLYTEETAFTVTVKSIGRVN